MKKIISLSIALIIAFSSLTYASGDGSYEDGFDAGYSEGYSDGLSSASKPKEPNIIFNKQEKIPTVAAGEILNLSIDYKNDSDYAANDIKITPSFDDVPLVYEIPVEYESPKSLRANASRTASFSFKIKDDAKIGVYGIKFKVEYQNNSDANFSRERIVYFKVDKEKVKTLVTINNIITEPANVIAGERFVLKFNVNNIGDIPMKGTYLKLSGLGTDTFMPVDGNELVYIGDVESKSSITQNFEMIASKDITKGNHTLGLDITYNNLENEEITEKKTVYILDVLSEKIEESTSGKPKIIIESYATMPNSIVAGSKFTFNFNFKNTSKEKSINNMKITISSDDGAFMIANGSNTFYIEHMAPGEIATRGIDLNVKQDLTSKSYPIDISFDYEDSKANSHQALEVINIPVVEYSNLVINSVFANQAILGSETGLSFDYINMGKAKVSNLTASVEGDYTAAQSINYIGNLEAGNSDYYDIQVIPSKEGENRGILVLTFEDSSGKKVEVKKDFIGYAMTPMNDPMPGDIGMYDPGMMEPVEPVKEPLSAWAIAGIGFASFLVSFIITKTITVKIVRKKLEDEI
ncbi:MAG: hypothetical protein IJO08_03965 [Clostridia bacterium]|nr:hypothetical protein [Clostridia bacterium]